MIEITEAAIDHAEVTERVRSNAQAQSARSWERSGSSLATAGRRRSTTRLTR